MPLKTQSDVFKIALPAGKAEAVFFDEGKQKDRAPGLALRIRAAGSRKFIFIYRQNGKLQKITIGDASSWTLDRARIHARGLRVQVDLGEVPGARGGPSITLSTAVTKYLEARDPDAAVDQNLRLSPRSYSECQRYLNEYWKPLHKHALGKVTRRDITGRFDEIAIKHGPIAAARARSALSSLYAWAIQGDADLTNPVIGSRRIADNSPRDRTLTDAELVAIWNGVDPTCDYGRIIRLLMLTACRREEIAGLRWDEIHALNYMENSEVRLPGIRTKNGTPHSVPLSAPASAVLRGTPRVDDRENVFGIGAGGFSGFSKAKAALDAALGGTVAPWTVHDLRRTVRTGMGRQGVPPHVAEAVLNHLPAKLIRTYDTNPYAAEKRAALDAWAGHVLTILARADGAHVVPIRA